MADGKREIKTTLALDGEKQFKASMDDAYRAMKVLGSEMKANTAEFGKNSESMEGLTSKGQLLEKQITQQKEIVEALTKAVTESAQAYGDTDKKTDEYRIKLNNATASLTNMEGELKNNQSEINNFGQEVEDTEKKTISWGDALSAVGSGLQTAAVATGAAMAAIGAAAVAAGKQIFDLTREAGTFADDLLTLSAQTGISTTSLQEWTYAAQFIDTEVETMTGSMAKMIKQMDSAREGTGASAEAFAALGVGITSSTGELLNSEEVFFAAIDALGQVANETERDALAMQLFGKSAQDLNPLIQAGSEQLKVLGAEAQAAGLIMSDEALTSFGQFDDSMNRITSTLTSIGRNIASVFLPAIQSAADSAQDLFSTINKSLQDGLQPEDVETIGKKIAEKLSDGMRKITEYLPQVISTVTSVLSKLVSFAVEYLPKLMPMLMDAAVKLLQGAIKAITDNIAKISDMVTTLIKSFVSFITQNLPAITKVAVELMIALAKGLVGAIPEVIRALPEIISALISGFGTAIRGFVEVGGQLVAGLWEGIQGAAAWIWRKINDWLGGIWKSIKGFFGISSPSKLMAETIGKPMVQGMAEGIIGNASLIDKAIGKLMPSEVYSDVVMNVTRQVTDVATSQLSLPAVPKRSTKEIARSILEDQEGISQAVFSGMKAALREQGDTVLQLNDREMGRYIRGAIALA